MGSRQDWLSGYEAFPTEGEKIIQQIVFGLLFGESKWHVIPFISFTKIKRFNFVTTF